MIGSDELASHQRRSGGIPLDPTIVSPPDRLGYPCFLHYSDAAAEFRAAQQECALIDVSDRSQIELAGKDARSFLHNFCTNDIKRLAAGEGCEAFMTNVKGRILAHVFAFVTDDAVWLDLPRAHEEAILAHLDHYHFHEDVELRSRTSEFGEVFVAGPRSPVGLSQLGLQVGSMRPYQHASSAIDGLPAVVRRVELWQSPGFLLLTARPSLVDLWQKLAAAAVRPAGAQVFHCCRIQAGFPISGIDVTEENLAQEAARTDRAISFTKGCYLGQEPIARLDALGHVNRQLCRVGVESSQAPACGTCATDGDGHPVGSITSAAVVPAEGRSVALAMLRTSHSKPGTQVWLPANDQQIVAEVF